MASNLTNTKFKGAMVLRAFAVVGLATSLAGCYTDRTPEGAYANDYRLRHPITLSRLRNGKLSAQAGPCGLWPYDLGPSYDPGLTYLENRPYWNFGCASQRNLAAMVDNPADLVQPRRETPPWAARRSVAIDKYRKGESPSGKYDGYAAGKISDLK